MNSILQNFDLFVSGLTENVISAILGICLFILVSLLSKPVSKLAVKPVYRITQSPLVLIVVRRIFRFIIVMLGFYLFLRLAGLTEFAVAIISGTGLAGLIVGFAFKDIAENFISSLLISIQKPFRIGDLLTIDTHKGVVNQVTSRATTLVDFDGNHIQIPNSIVYKSVVKNFTANPKMRIDVHFGIGYDASVNEVQAIIRDQLKRHSAVLSDPEPQVVIATLGSSTINIDVYFWVNSVKTSVLKMKSLIQKNVLEALLEAEISMPDDARERIIINQDSHVDNHVTQDKTRELKPIGTRPKTDADSEDVVSEIAEIKDQAKQSRSPESGENIL